MPVKQTVKNMEFEKKLKKGLVMAIGVGSLAVVHTFIFPTTIIDLVGSRMPFSIGFWIVGMTLLVSVVDKNIR